jgi:hypothetical protein
LQTSQGYIIRILQHFATKLWNLTNFVMLFQAVMKYLSRLVEFKIVVNWGNGPLESLSNCLAHYLAHSEFRVRGEERLEIHV